MAMQSTATPRPRITHVVRQFWPQKGGLEESVLQLCKTLHRGFDVDIDVVTLDRTFSDGVSHPMIDTVEGIPVRRIGFRGSQRYPLAPDILNATSGADIIHVHAIDFFFDALALARPLRSIPMVASTHGGFFHTKFAARFKKAYFATATRAACRAYDLVGASSIADAERFRAIAGDRVEVIENGVDIAKWAGASSRDFVPVMIAIGRWSSNKNLAALFPLLRELRLARPDWRLLIAGKAYDVSREDLDQWATAQGVSDAVEIHDAPDIAALGRLIGRASFFVSLSDYEGFGISVVEGLSAGLVPILSEIANYRCFVDRAGIGENIGSDPIGAARKVESLAALVEADHPLYRRRAIEAAERYEWSAVAARWGSVYTSALAGKNKGPIRARA
jgi:alpha-1,3-mannosyltransferase